MAVEKGPGQREWQSPEELQKEMFRKDKRGDKPVDPSKQVSPLWRRILVAPREWFGRVLGV